MGGNVECMGESRGVYRVLVGKPEGKNTQKTQVLDGRIMDLQEVGCGGRGLDLSGSG
jgi:hypothetical protein